MYITQGNHELAHCTPFSHCHPFGACAAPTAAVDATSTAPLTIRSETFCYKKIFNMLNVTWSESPFYVLSCMKIMSNVLCFIWLVLCSSTSWIVVHTTRTHSIRQWYGRLVGLWAHACKCEWGYGCECMCVHNVPEYKTTHYSGGRMIVSHLIRCCCCCCSSAQWVTLTFSWEIISLSFLMCGFHAHTFSIPFSLTLSYTLTFTLILTFLKPFDLSPYNFILRPFQS